MSNVALTTAQPSSLMFYPNEDDPNVTNTMAQVMRLHPAATQYDKRTMLEFTMLAVAAGANPFPGPQCELDIWESPSKYVRGKWIPQPPVMYLNVKYWRRKVAEIDRVIWLEEPRLMTSEERLHYSVSDSDIGTICRGARVSQVRELVQMGVPYKEAKEDMARTAVAYVKYDDMNTKPRNNKPSKPIPPPRGQSWNEVACKRVEVACYRELSLAQATYTPNQDLGFTLPRDMSQVMIAEGEDLNTSLFGGDSSNATPIVIEHEPIKHEPSDNDFISDDELFSNDWKTEPDQGFTGVDSAEFDDKPSGKVNEVAKSLNPQETAQAMIKAGSIGGWAMHAYSLYSQWFSAASGVRKFAEYCGATHDDFDAHALTQAVSLYVNQMADGVDTKIARVNAKSKYTELANKSDEAA